MTFLRPRLSGTVAIVAVLAVSACAQHGALLPTASQAVVAPDLNPPSCKGQVNKSDYSTLTGQVNTRGGAFCIPEYGGFGGKLDYPNLLTSSITLTLGSSTVNYDNFQNLGSGTPIFYLGFTTSAAVTFGSTVRTHNGLSSNSIIVGDPYTAYGEATVYGFPIKFGPCYTTATKGKYGGVLSGIGGLLKGRNIPVKVSGVIEIYSGEQTSTQC
ncbi:MAG TPA: hypothetical protein VKR56_07915 [Candidatus Cybelea sp.]|nr:hypothetical protein [Candidatus Cybelea sp.]